MASTSTSSSTSPPNDQPSTTKFDVFLSFRGEDTRHTFTDHLYEALFRAGVSTFRDNDEIDRGQQLKPEIEAAIIASKASILVLSENYAGSRWCLDELCLILEQRRECGHFVLPVFYHVDPSDVRNQRGSFAVRMSERTDGDFRRWKEALTEVANLTGLVVSGSRSESNFIAEVVETITCKLDMKQLSTPAHLIGMEARVEVINSWLRYEQSNVIAICGMGGSGKTTLARCIYNLNKQYFESSSFLDEIGKHSIHGLLGLQKQLLSDVLQGKGKMISSVSEGTHKIEGVLQKKRLLIVLDDVDDQDELSALLGTKKFLTQSKIIITTRNLDINAWLASISWRCLVHKIKLLNDLESLELLSCYAFRSKTPMKDFKELAIQLAQYCGGNPLALKVLGSSLFVSDKDTLTINSMMGIWISRMNSLKSLKGNIHCKIQGVLRKSFDSLPQPNERELFLHIACLFVGESSSDVKAILEDELYATSGIETLIKRCLLTISRNGELMMHELLQELGRKIVYEESKDPAKRSRVWHDTESYRVLKKGDGSDTIEGLSFDIRNVEQEMRLEVSTLKTSSLSKMEKLKLLRLKYVEFTGCYENFPDLIWLCWHGFPLQTMPSGLLVSSLVVIDMSHGHMEKFEAPTVLNSLKSLNLKGCGNLVSIDNFNRLPKLEKLSLWGCSSLTHVCNSIGDLRDLKSLFLTGCTKLWKFVHKPETMMLPKRSLLSLPQQLMWFELTNCGLEFNSDVCVAFHAQSCIRLFLASNPFEYLPTNIDLKMLCTLNLYCCPNLKSLPCIPSTLEVLFIDWCTSLDRVTFQSGRFTLRGFSYEGCFKLFEVQGLFKLVPVAKIDKANLGDMQWIKAYENYKVDLVGDEITKGKIWNTQMLYEYGIRSTYLQCMKDQILPTYDYASSNGFLSFFVPFDFWKNKIKGLNVSCLYRSSGPNVQDVYLWAKISNKSKGLSWVYNPIVYCKPRVDEDIVWLTYWPIGNMLDAGDEVNVVIYRQSGTMVVSGCGASLVYMNDMEVDKEEDCDNSTLKEEEVIGGDLSAFEVSTGCYYLCRRDFFGQMTSFGLKYFFGDDVHYNASQGWEKTHQTASSMWMKDYSKNTFLKIIELGVIFDSECEIGKIEKAVSSTIGVESVSAHKEMGKLIVTGYVDPVEMATCVREFDNMVVEILSVKIILE